jgi:DNA-binding NarL/FixJ family response regulator
VSYPISILVADDHALIRSMLESQLAAEPDMKVVASVADARRAVEEARALAPDVVLMDIDMPGLLSFEAARTIRRYCSTTRVIFLSAFFHDRYIEEALRAEASGYVTKNESPGALVAAIRKVSRGFTYFSPEVQDRLVVGVDGLSLKRRPRTRGLLLTDRETETLRYVAQGLSKKEIAGLMDLSVRTVDAHVRNVMTKLNIHDRVELTRFAIREGLAEP